VLLHYVDRHLYDHLCAATTGFLRVHARNISDDHPAVEILHDLETTAYYVDESKSGRLARSIVHVILRWTDMLNCRLTVGGPYVLWFHFSDTTSKGLAVSVSNVDLMTRVCHLTNKIYREILCITRDERMTYIFIGGLDDNQVSTFSWSTFSWTLQYKIALSWGLLAWISGKDGIPRSFTNFITTPELSGPLYISPDIYHTQITEYSLETILRNFFK
jgi:hypothetical protein